MDFKSFGLDERLLKAIAKLGWAKPTIIQKDAIPIVIAGKDVIIKAFTGSGKTAIFLIPIIQKLLNDKEIHSTDSKIRALILVPSKDLSNQIYENLKKLTYSCSDEINFVQLNNKMNMNYPYNNNDIIISTPSSILSLLDENKISISFIEMLVVDEADLLLSFGYGGDFRQLTKYIPRTCQTILISATLNKDIKFLKNMMPNDPLIIKLKDSNLPPQTQLSQYVIRCDEDEEKFTLCYILLKLKLLRGKTIFFVNTIDRGYKLKLYLELFGIKCCLLNSELPLLSRCHIMNQFNEGLYDYVIAADESLRQINTSNKAKSLKSFAKDKEFRASRGLDFQRISNVVNFDFPKTVKSYIHRVGRTARADNNGTALSLIKDEECEIFKKVEKYLNPKNSTFNILEPIIKTFNVPIKQLDGFRYRSTDAYKSITRILIKEARFKEIKTEILNNEKLKIFFHNNPHDFAVLRHDNALNIKNSLVKSQVASHLKHIPDYLIPNAFKELTPNYSSTLNNLAHKKNNEKLPKYKKQKMVDPLKSFKF
ncbi:unnamed protein product [Gordionus sp. m RMFG-2023]